MKRRKFSLKAYLPSNYGISVKTDFDKTMIRMLIRAFYHKPDIFGINGKMLIDRNFIFNVLKD